MRRLIRWLRRWWRPWTVEVWRAQQYISARRLMLLDTSDYHVVDGHQRRGEER